MIELVLQSPDVEAFRSDLLDSGREGCVVLFTRAALLGDSSRRLLAASFIVPEPEAYLRRGPSEAQLSPDFVARVAKRAARDGCGLVFVHSHPGTSPPRFSKTDNEGEAHLGRFLRHRVPKSIHAALVVSAGGMAARVLGSKQSIRVSEVGIRRKLLFGGTQRHHQRTSKEYDRQVRAFGAQGQQQLNDLSVGIIGLGGTGSIVAQELVHLGVCTFLLVDPDTVDRTNLNRLANARPSDVGRPKVHVAKRYIKGVNPRAEVGAVVGDVIRSVVARRLAGVDILLGCTDSHGSRAVMQQIAYQYLVPCIDMGSTIVSLRGSITHIQGRVQMLAPGLPCLTCSGLLDPNEVRRDMMTAFERKVDPYTVGDREPAPAVMSLNGTIASLAVTMLLFAVTGLRNEARHLLYNALSSSLRVIAPSTQPDCFICSRSGALARGDDAPLMARQD